MAQKKTTPYKRENIPASRLEMDMLEYQLKEARDTVEKQSQELNRVVALLEQTTKVADQRGEKVTYLTKLSAKLSKRVSWWKLAAIMEGVFIVAYAILQGV